MCLLYCFCILYIVFTNCVLDIYSQNSTYSSSNDFAGSTNKTTIYIGGYFSHGGVWDCSGVLPAVEMALDHINERSDILADYDLRMVWNDTQCEAGEGTRVLFHQLFHEPQKLILIGDGCSTSSQAIAATAYHWNLNMVSYAASAPSLSNRVNYPYFYRTIMPDTMFNPARIRLMKEFNWTKVATIHGDHEIFALTAADLNLELREANVTSTEIFASKDLENQIKKLKEEEDAKIITVNMYATRARRVLCEAYRNGMVGPGYVWMLVGWYAQKWWEVPDKTVKCSPEEMRKAARLSHYISTESLQLSTSSDLTIANITAAEYVVLLKKYMEHPRWADYEWHNDNPLGYDAAWAIALMLDKAAHIVNDTLGRRLEDFTYDDKEMGEIFFNLLNLTKFIGVSGPVSFRDGDRVGIIQIRQLQAGCQNSSWKLHDEDCFLFVEQPLSYPEAVRHCNDSGAVVAAIVNESEYRFIVETLQNNDEYSEWFIGLKKVDKREDSRFEDLDWTPPGSNLNTNGQQCVSTTIGLQNGLKSVSCETPLPFICRKEADFLERPVAMFTDTGVGNGDFHITGEFIWPGGKVPLDHTPVVINNLHVGISTPLYATMCFFASCGIVLSVFFLAFNIRYRQQRFVKMSSPSLNNLILIGSMLAYAGIFVGGLDAPLVAVNLQGLCCHLQAYFLSLGFVLGFGAMFAKTWRVHKIAAFKTPKRKIITDNQLFCMVSVIVLIDICVLVLWHAIDPMKSKIKNLYPTDERLQPYYEYCECTYHVYWLVTLYSYKALMLIFGTFLAWETRKVAISGLNDSKLIGMSVYNIVVLCTIGVAVSFVIDENPAASFIFTSCVVMFCTGVTLIIIFVPKLISVYRYPDGPPPTNKGTAVTVDSGRENIKRIENLEHENDKLKKKLKKMECSHAASPGINRVRLSSGCGLWCAGAICGCCSNTPEEPYQEAYRPRQNGFENGGFDARGQNGVENGGLEARQNGFDNGETDMPRQNGFDNAGFDMAGL